MNTVQQKIQEVVSTPPLSYLANLYPHERIEFDEGPHIYTIDGSSDGC